MADRGQDPATPVPPHAQEPRSELRKRRGGIQLIDLGPSRPPCSVAEREIADAVQRRFTAAGWASTAERVRAPTSPTWAPLVRSLLRVWAAAFLAAGWPGATIGLGAAAVLGGIPSIAGLLRFIPLLGSTSRNIVSSKQGRDPNARPLIVAAHLDTHSTGTTPMSRIHVYASAASGWLVLVAGFIARPMGWRAAAGVVAAEAVITLVWLSRHELKTPREIPDDNTSGLISLVRVAELLDGTPLRNVWLVATAAGTAGSYGLRRFLKSRPQLRNAWVVEIDALGAGELVASPLAPRFPHPGTPPTLSRAIEAASRESGDPISVRRVRRAHSDARAALRRRIAAITLTAGIGHPEPSAGPDTANAERAARVVEGIARFDV
jgi:hypothetical protein